MDSKFLAIIGAILITVLVVMISKCGDKTIVQKTMKCDCVEVQ